jgi:hypothetical protein
LTYRQGERVSNVKERALALLAAWFDREIQRIHRTEYAEIRIALIEPGYDGDIPMVTVRVDEIGPGL